MTKSKWFILLSVLTIATGITIAYRSVQSLIDEITDELFNNPDNWGM